MHIEKKKKRKAFAEATEGDLTPMIDMVFQLIAFFMVLINFTQAEQDKRIQLPVSALAKPPETKLERVITLHVDDENDTIIYSGRELSLKELEGQLRTKVSELKDNGFEASDAIVIIRGDRYAKTGFVQQVIEACQIAKFEKFRLRAVYKKPK